MSNRLSKGPIQVVSTDIAGLNYAFQQIQTEIDEIRGLRGRASLYDRVRVSDPTEDEDAVNLGTGTDTFQVQAAGRMTYATDNVRYTDTNGTVLHGFGNVP